MSAGDGQDSRPAWDQPAQWGDASIRPGEDATIHISVSESYAGADIRIPAWVCRGERPGPTVCVTAAVHGDEINGTGAIRHLVRDRLFALRAGTLVCVPVVNIFGFERHSRYLPDRRDLNRCFPGSPTGSLASRLGHALFEKIIRRSDYGIDFHTAAVRRTNFPNLRADLSDSRLAAFARAFGAELIIDSAGPQGALRRAALEHGCAVMTFEIGEAWKVEPVAVDYCLYGLTNCLCYLGMIDGNPRAPAYRVETETTRWVRAEVGGFLEFHIAPGEIVQRGDVIATNTSLLGDRQNLVLAPHAGIVMGMTTLPSVAPGDPVCHLASPRKGELRRIARAVDALPEDSLHARMRDDLARNLRVTPAPVDRN